MAHSHKKLAKLLSAIQAVEAGPSADDLMRAPLIQIWLTVSRSEGVICLLGEVINHPTLGTDDILTSPVVGLNRTECWVRTLSRWYRLGKPLFVLRDGLADQFRDPAGHPASVRFDDPGLLVVEDPATVDHLIAKFVSLVRIYTDDDPA